MFAKMKSIVGRSWKLVAAHRVLWIAGLFAGASAGANISVGDSEISGLAVAAVLIVGLGVALASVVAEGALIFGTAEADAGRPPRGASMLREGLRHFWRVLGVKFSLVLAMAAVVAVVAAPALATATVGGVTFGLGAATTALFALAAVPVLLGLYFVGRFALRATVLERASVAASLGRGYALVRARLGEAFVLLVSEYIAGVAAQLAATALVVPVAGVTAAVYLAAGGSAALATGLVLGVPVLALCTLIASAHGAFRSTVWTLGYLDA